ncbi:hypothetical protein HPB50_016357 [Hyalomma asiaticum]|uniref:Uncharacterized protein n=1 Tax=Hyalomma asiaticum TaxID=266040 RepID=A0ACB7SRG0_HYAAI|nr:hypothetical protein HPB50_016357 [Hyalomma asiaticum]
MPSAGLPGNANRAHARYALARNHDRRGCVGGSTRSCVIGGGARLLFRLPYGRRARCDDRAAAAARSLCLRSTDAAAASAAVTAESYVFGRRVLTDEPP